MKRALAWGVLWTLAAIVAGFGCCLMYAAGRAAFHGDYGAMAFIGVMALILAGMWAFLEVTD